MTLFNRISVAATIVSTLAFASCADDVYDPNKEPENPPANENPLGEGFTAPQGFDWSMINSVKLNVEVKDEFQGKFQYLVEVFTTSPFTKEATPPIAAGLAKGGKNYTVEINLPKTITRLYIRQTDPKQRLEVYEVEVPENGGALNAKLYYTAGQTKAFTRAIVATPGTSGWEEVEKLGLKKLSYTETDLKNYTTSDDFIEYTPGQLKNGSVYIIPAGTTYAKFITSENWKKGKATVIVKGTWDMSQISEVQGLKIYVAAGGKITGSKIAIGNGCELEVQKGGTLEGKTFSTQTDVPIKNFGTFKVKSASTNTGSILYNAEEATFTVTGDFNKMMDSHLHNRGEFTVGGMLDTNNSPAKVIIANYPTGVINVNMLLGGSTIVNDNRITVNEYDVFNVTLSWLYNNCTFIAKTSFKCANVMLDHGSITGGLDKDGSWLPVEKRFDTYNASKTPEEGNLILKNGSIIKAKDIKCGSDLEINAVGESASMIQTKSIKYNSNTILNGNLVLAVTTEDKIGSNVDKNTSVVTVDYDGYKNSIETCSGILYEGNAGGDPTTPSVPEITEDKTTYTYAFEDNWPLYGDLDLNDIILTLNNKKVETTDGKVTKVSFKLILEAVGAKKTLGAGIRLLGLSKNPASFTINGQASTWEAGQSKPTTLLFANAHAAFGYPDSAPFINSNPDLKDNTTTLPNYDIELTFAKGDNVLPEAFNIGQLDVFIINRAADTEKKKKRQELHVAGFAPTELANTALFGTGNDASREGHYYFSTENLAFAIMVPARFAWPQESHKVTDVYGEFVSWITGGGVENKDWYNHPTGPVFNFK